MGQRAKVNDFAVLIDLEALIEFVSLGARGSILIGGDYGWNRPTLGKMAATKGRCMLPHC